MKCRICGSNDIRELDTVEYYEGFAWEIRDCGECGCRFTDHDPSIYETLHASCDSRYGEYRNYAEQCETLYAAQDLIGLRDFIRMSPKSRFVMDTLKQHLPTNGKLLEVGCSRGYLTSYFLLAGYDVRGVDVSSEAIRAAQLAFGDHFFLSGSPEIGENAPYDGIYHQGMIGCVANPIALTADLIDLLKPGGVLAFNAPNVGACWLKGQPWVESAPPPDLVTLFPKGFWKQHFGDVGEIVEVVDCCDEKRALQVYVRRLTGQRWQRPVCLPLVHGKSTLCPTGLTRHAIWRRAINKAGRLVEKATARMGVMRLAPALPAEFGLYVKMIKRR